MSIYIRLQNLPWSATSADIRRFFGKLEIPEGGVHITGGDQGEAFIRFNSYGDTKMALERDGCVLKNNKVRLMLSSTMELQYLIDEICQNSYVPPRGVEPLPPNPSSGDVSHRSSDYSNRKTSRRSVERSSRQSANRSRDMETLPQRDGRKRRSPDRHRGVEPLPPKDDRSPRRSDQRRRVQPLPPKDNRTRRSPNQCRGMEPLPPKNSRTRRSPDHRRGVEPLPPKDRRSSDRHRGEEPLPFKDSRPRRSPDQHRDFEPLPYRDNDRPRRSLEQPKRQSDQHRSQHRTIRKSPNRALRRSPERSLDRLNRRSPVNSYLRSSDCLRSSPESRERRRSLERIQTSIYHSHSQSPTIRSNHYHSSSQSGHEGSRTHIVHRSSPGSRDIESLYPDPVVSSYDRKSEGGGGYENIISSSGNQIFQPNVGFVESTDLYDRRSFQPSFEQQEYYQPEQPTDDLDIFTQYIAKRLQEEKTNQELARIESFSHPVDSRNDKISYVAPLPSSDYYSSTEVYNHRPKSEGVSDRWAQLLQDTNSIAYSQQNSANFMDSSITLESEQQQRVRENLAYSNNYVNSQFEDMVRMNSGTFQSAAASNTFRPHAPIYCVKVIGLRSKSSFKDIHSLFKGCYVPQKNIYWDVNRHGYKSGTAFVKLDTREDLEKMLQNPDPLLDGKVRVHISNCPVDVSISMFPPENYSGCNIDFRNDLPQSNWYMLKGLPYAVIENDIAKFFTGLSIADLIILYDTNGKATGTGFIKFATLTDFLAAKTRNGKKIAHRYIELLETTPEEVENIKKTVEFSQKKPTISDTKNSLTSIPKLLPKWPLCAILAGLPSYVVDYHVSDFFSTCGLKPDAIHIILNDQMKPNGKAYVEFRDPFDFDIALKMHGKCLGSFAISIKQVLYEEMMNVINTHYVQEHFPRPNKRSSNTEPALVIPEKVPYLWEPPDSEDIESFDNKDPGVAESQVQTNPQRRRNRKTKNRKKRSSMTAGRQSSRGSNCNIVVSPGMSSWNEVILPPKGAAQTEIQGNLGPSYPDGQQASFQAFSDSQQHEVAGSRTPVRFEMKGRQGVSTTNTLKDDLVEASSNVFKDASAKFYDNEVPMLFNPISAHKEVSMQNEVISKVGILNTQNSPQQTGSTTNKAAAKDIPEKSIDNGMPIKPSSAVSQLPSNASKSKNPRGPISGVSCIVHVSNVQSDVDLDDILDFFDGFNLKGSDVIQKFSDSGEPTGDLRIKFHTHFDADTAIQLLNYRTLHGVPLKLTKI